MICGGMFGGRGPSKGEKRRKEAVERALPGGPKRRHLAVLSKVFVHKFQAFAIYYYEQ